MIYVIDHNDSFTHNVVHQFALFDKVECDNYDKISENKIKQASTIIFSPGPGEKIIVDACLILFSLTLS